MMATRNTHTGGGTQNNRNAVNQNINHGRDQNINYGRDQYNVSGDLIRNITTTVEDIDHMGLEKLWGATAGIGASHKAEQQYSRGECLEGTRTKALRTIFDWTTEQVHHPICWLSGAAGVGKTAIAITVAKAWEAEDSLVSSFFFFRSDPKRNNPLALWLTIAHGLAMRYASCRAFINKRIVDDSTILEGRLEDQFLELIREPAPEQIGILPGLPPSSETSDIIIIDGLDECGDEDTQLRIIATIQSAFQRNPRFPFRFLIISRSEAWIREAFAAGPLRRLTKFVLLDDKFSPDRDIMQYYLHHFKEIVGSLKYSQVQFPDPWPSVEDLEALVIRACGQFIYAATVIKFLKLAFTHPVMQLRVILDNASSSGQRKSPFPALDALYDIVLSTNPDYDQVLPILASILILPDDLDSSPASIEQVLGLPQGQVALTLRAMHSVLDIRGLRDPIRHYHTSFRDYLLDQTRSRNFHVDIYARMRVIARHCVTDFLSLHLISLYLICAMWLSYHLIHSNILSVDI
ncbi:hypothetical protein PM082_006855 [Marasmius tenuissimus]|nr:hypothetical protein PM082_006855 [Marasmius tenuissimus]